MNFEGNYTGMGYKLALCLIFLPIGFCFDDNVRGIALEYFNYREVKSICLLTCERNINWRFKFVKEAHQKSVSVSNLDLDGADVNYEKIGKCLKQTFVAIGVLIDATCSNFEDVLNFSSYNMMLDSTHKWLIIENTTQVLSSYNDTELAENTVNNNMVKTVGILKNLNISVDADIVMANEGTIKYDLFEAFNFGKVQGGNLTITKIGSWDEENGLTVDVDLNGFKYYRRWNFQQWSMRMIIVMMNPPEHFDPELVKGEVLAPGIAYITQTSATILHVVAEIHNFRFQYSTAETWVGNFSREHSKKVVVTSLFHREQDISPVLRAFPEFTSLLDVVMPPLTAIETRYYYRIPTYGPGKFENQFIRPLSTGTWLCVIAVIILCAFGLSLSAKFEHRPMPLQYALFSVIASFCQQFFEDSSEPVIKRISNARRLVALVTGLSCVLIYNYYTSSVVSWLLNGPPPSINSLQELLESPIQLIYEDIGYTRSWLQVPNYYYNKRNAKVEDELRLKKVLSKKKDDPLFLQPNKGIEMVKAGGFAYHTEVNTANMLISRKFSQMELCELGSLQSMDKALLYPAVQKRSPYKEFLVWSLARVTERGIVSCIQHRTSSAPVSCEGSSPRALTLGGAAPAFLLLVFGYFCAIIIMLLERVPYPKVAKRTAKLLLSLRLPSVSHEAVSHEPQ